MITEKMRQDWKKYEESNKGSFVLKGLSNEDIQVRLMENQMKWCKDNLGAVVAESNAPGSVNAHAARWQPLLINMAKRLAPMNVGNQFFGVQPMSGPDGQIFAMRARVATKDGANGVTIDMNSELFMGEGDSGRTGGVAQAGDPSGFNLREVTANPADDNTETAAGRGMSTAESELLGSQATGAKEWARVGVTIQKAAVSAKSRGVYADYSHELRQDMMNVHGEDADSILADIMLNEIQTGEDREVIRLMNFSAKRGTTHGANGIVDIQTHCSGRWAVEKWKYLLYILDLEANMIAKETRRGKGNKVLCSPNVASALVMAGMLDYATALAAQANLKVDVTSQVYAGKLANGMDVFIDPYAGAIDYITIAFKGASQLDAGAFIAPYIPVEMYKTVGEDTFQPRMAFKSRRGLVANPFVQIATNSPVATQVTTEGFAKDANPYFRKIAIKGLYIN
ncbi:major capsid protein [Vibrio phage vB_VchM_Kuja]|uniref:Major capsid protein n=1 Tax=Vibrio phage vB_VchM_Kuja TaxID=2686437 RepID=A0A6B9J9K6_9CAUD|nr:major capsid protein [Vibrio phage vB_VchM_Kuja]QGZ16159.1 major capsid protein [Vibrio phage vB_VchM_Kuja]